MQKFFEKSKLSIDKIYISSAKRAALTFEGIYNSPKNNEKFSQIPIEFSEELYNIHHKNIEYFADFIRFFDDTKNTIMVVAHNPMFDNFVQEYTNETLHISTGSLVQIEFEMSTWSELKK